MRGQLWSEYLIIVSVFALVGLLAFAYIYGPIKGAVVCTSVHAAVLSEITRQETNSLVDLTLKNVSCDLDRREVNVYCDCLDINAIRQAVQDVLNRLGEKNVSVVVFG